MKVDIFIVDKTICNGKDIFDGYLGESVFCAGVMEGGKDACQVIEQLINTLLTSLQLE